MARGAEPPFSSVGVFRGRLETTTDPEQVWVDFDHHFRRRLEGYARWGLDCDWLLSAELAQDALLRFFEVFTRPDSALADDCKLEPYLRRICYHLFVNQFRRQRREQPLPDDPEQLEAMGGTEGDVPEQTYEQKRLLEDYGDCMTRQHLDQDPVFRQALEGISVRKIAGALGLTHGKVDRQIHRVRALLLDCLTHVHGWANEDISGVLQCSNSAKQ